MVQRYPPLPSAPLLCPFGYDLYARPVSDIILSRTADALQKWLFVVTRSGANVRVALARRAHYTRSRWENKRAVHELSASASTTLSSFRNRRAKEPTLKRIRSSALCTRGSVSGGRELFRARIITRSKLNIAVSSACSRYYFDTRVKCHRPAAGYVCRVIKSFIS